MRCASVAFCSALSASIPAQEGKQPYELGYDGGFFVRSADGRNELVLEGLFQADAIVPQADRGRVAEFFVHRMRPELAGRIDGAYRFRVEPRFREDDVELEEAWVGVDLGDDSARLMLGRMKAPFNLEEVRSRRHIDFARFSILNQFAPAEDHGVFVNGSACDDAFEYGFAFYNGTGGADTTSSKDVALRAAVRPFSSCGGALANAHVGMAATWGRQDESVGGDSLVNAFDRDLVDFAAGTRLDGDRWRAGLELAWFGGPFLVQSEVLWVRQRMTNGGVATDIDFAGAYVSASCVLTGEERRGWGGVRPDDPFDPREGTGAGAWVLALRLSELAIDPRLRDAGFALPGRYTERVRSAELGLNWIPTDHVIVRTAWVHGFYSDDVMLGSGRASHEGALVFECQLHW